MIPLSLSLQGIYSYQAKQTIDFTRLTAAGIFGIFGPVGSGKSTIIEAITYALYGRTDRLNLSGDNRNYNMMNLKSNELLIEFIFRAGDGTEFMAIVRSRRNNKKFDEVKTVDRTAYQKIDENWIPTETSRMEESIGLSYDNFKRTVIIPQGKFQEFLLLGNKDRTDMMKELFDLDKYELYYKVVSLETKTNQQKQLIEGNLQQLGNISVEMITACENELQQTARQIEIVSQKLVRYQAEELGQRNLKELIRKATDHQLQIDKLKSQEKEILELEKKIAGYEFYQVNFKALIEAKELAVKKTGELKSAIDADELLSVEISAQLKSLETTFESTRKEHAEREILKHQADELLKIKRILEIENQVYLSKERIVNGEKFLTDTKSRIEAIRSDQERLTGEIKSLKASLPDIGLLSKIREWFTVSKMLASSGREIETEATTAKAETEELIRQKSILFNSSCFTGIAVDAAFDQILVQLDEKKKTHLHAKEILNQEIQHLQVQLKLQEYATELEEGKPCPLCGSLDHPLKFSNMEVSDKISQTRKETEHHDLQLADLEKGMKKLSDINAALCMKEGVLAKILQKQNEQRAKVSAHNGHFTWEIKSEAELTEAFTKAEKTQTLILAREEAVEKSSKNLDKEMQNLEKYNQVLESLRSDTLALNTESGTYKKQLNQLTLSDYETQKPESLAGIAADLLKKYTEIETKFTNQQTKIQEFRKQGDILKGRLEANRKTQNAETDQLKEISGKLDAKLAESQISLIQVQEILKWNVDLNQEKSTISRFKQEIDFASKQLALLQTEIGNRQFEQQVYEALLKEIEHLNEELKTANRNFGKQESELKKLRSDLELHDKLLSTFEKLGLRLENIKTLKQLFKGSGFVNYISGVYLRELCQMANERFFKLSGQKLSLEVTQENNFEVRDFMNGGKVRSIKTLSGGQTFQAALSLALALSDNNRKTHGANENFFFLDEGFGSLDKASLETVFDTLKSLRRENRTVGIISHVEDMQAEIDIHLRVENYEESGSMIEKSWERKD